MPGGQRLRWPTGAETIRVDCIEAAQTAATIGRAAQQRLDRARAALATGRDPELLIADTGREIADMITQLECITRKLVEAKVGK